MYQLFWEQIVSPIWQGMLWGLGGVALYHARFVFAKVHAQRPPPVIPGRSAKPFLSQLLARLGLGGLAI